MNKKSDILLIQPPFVQPNTPYPAVPMLTNFLRKSGICVHQRDFSLELLRKIFSREFILQAGRQAAMRPAVHSSATLHFFVDAAEDYAATIEDTLAFLQGKRPELAWRIAARTLLPEGPHFRDIDETGELTDAYGVMGTTEQAKFLASKYLDDLSSFIAAACDPDFGFGKYGEQLAVALPEMEPLLERLSKSTKIDLLLDEMTIDAISELNPDFVGISVPFPGTLYGAFRIAQKIREIAPGIKIILGGGYVNSELREADDDRIFDYFDFICYDDGFLPLLAIIRNLIIKPVTPDCNVCESKIKTRRGAFLPDDELRKSTIAPAVWIPDYDGLNLHKYFSIVEISNPMHRIWTDGTWLKIQLSHGCYWHKCAFCDLNLNYIKQYKPGSAPEIVDAMESLMEKTGHSGFHFVDEAMAPTLLRAICKEIIKRGIHPTWWGNIRFDKSFTPELAELMADAGCIAVTGGLECANDRLLKLMNKGITLASARQAMSALSEAGILIHAYLMYGFPTETASEAIGALDFVRQCFEDGILHSAFWHRFALTIHSAIAKSPEKFHIKVNVPKTGNLHFAQNELGFTDLNSQTDWDGIGRGLSLAVYNFMLGRGLDVSAEEWLND